KCWKTATATSTNYCIPLTGTSTTMSISLTSKTLILSIDRWGDWKRRFQYTIILFLPYQYSKYPNGLRKEINQSIDYFKITSNFPYSQTLALMGFTIGRKQKCRIAKKLILNPSYTQD